MRLRPCILPVLFLACAQAQQYTTTAGRQQDLNYISNTLTKIDGNFFSTLDPATFQTAVSALQSRISNASDVEFYTGLGQLVALSGDMHTALEINNGFGLPTLALTLSWLDNGLFVTSAAPAYSQTVGTQIIAVNGMPLAQVANLIGTAYAYANPQHLHWLVENYLTSLFLLQGLDIIPQLADTAPITFQTLGGTTFTMTVGIDFTPQVSGIPGPVPYYLQNPNVYYWFSYLSANRMLYAKYNVCEDDPKGISVATYSSQILQAIDANPVDTVVIDFRGNGGGSEYLLYPLGVGLFQRLPALSANPNFRIYLVIDKGSFSSGMYTPMAFKSGFLASFEGIAMPNTNGIMYVIGEPTGGKPIGFGNVVNFTLPYSKFGGYYSTVFVDQNEGVIPDLPSFYPDISVPMRSSDYFTGNDPVMAAMLARFAGAPAAPAGDVTTVNAASFRGDVGVAPGSLAAAFGSFPVVPDEVQIGGIEAALVTAGTSQVNFLVPASVATGPATISVRSSGQELSNGQLTIAAGSPGIFVQDAANPAQPGAIQMQGSIISIYATGYSSSLPTQVYIAGNPAQVQYSGPVAGLPGLWQINAQIPANTPTGTVPAFIASGNLASNAVTFAVHP